MWTYLFLTGTTAGGCRLFTRWRTVWRLMRCVDFKVFCFLCVLVLGLELKVSDMWGQCLPWSCIPTYQLFAGAVRFPVIALLAPEPLCHWLPPSGWLSSACPFAENPQGCSAMPSVQHSFAVWHSMNCKHIVRFRGCREGGGRELALKTRGVWLEMSCWIIYHKLQSQYLKWGVVKPEDLEINIVRM